MPSVRLEDLSPFARVCLKLDSELAELARSGEQISKVDLESDNGLDEGIKILGRVARYGESVAVTMQEFSSTLQEARDKAEASTALVAERAQVIQKRKQTQDALQEKLSLLKDEVKSAGESLSSVPAAGSEGPSDEDKRRIAAELEKFQAPLNKFIELIQAVKAECASGNYRRLERQADSMIDSLQSTRRKIAQALEGK